MDARLLHVAQWRLTCAPEAVAPATLIRWAARTNLLHCNSHSPAGFRRRTAVYI